MLPWCLHDTPQPWKHGRPPPWCLWIQERSTAGCGIMDAGYLFWRKYGGHGSEARRCEISLFCYFMTAMGCWQWREGTARNMESLFYDYFILSTQSIMECWFQSKAVSYFGWWIAYLGMDLWWLEDAKTLTAYFNLTLGVLVGEGLFLRGWADWCWVECLTGHTLESLDRSQLSQPGFGPLAAPEMVDNRTGPVRNHKIWAGFRMLKFCKMEILHHLNKQKIGITRLILKIQDSNFTCKPNFQSRTNHILTSMSKDHFFID